MAMKSPLPGMDPYLERHWQNVHASLVTAISGALNRALPDDLVAIVEERVAIEPDMPAGMRQDVQVVEPSNAYRLGQPEPIDTSGLSPYRIAAPADPALEHFVRIEETGSGLTVCVIEVVSPSNKVGDGLREYVAKRTELLECGSHVVEIDLVRRGRWNAIVQPQVCPPELKTTYRVTTRVATDASAVYVTPIALRDPLPEISIPLRAKDVKPRVNLQALLDDVYASGACWKWAHYSEPLNPPLEAADIPWAEERIRSVSR
jgi:hypothetical protein